MLSVNSYYDINLRVEEADKKLSVMKLAKARKEEEMAKARSAEVDRKKLNIAEVRAKLEDKVRKQRNKEQAKVGNVAALEDEEDEEEWQTLVIDTGMFSVKVSGWCECGFITMDAIHVSSVLCCRLVLQAMMLQRLFFQRWWGDPDIRCVGVGMGGIRLDRYMGWIYRYAWVWGV